MAAHGKPPHGQAAGHARQKQQPQQQHKQAHQPPHVKHVCRQLVAAADQEAKHLTLGTLAFAGLLFVAGAAPWALPAVFLAFSAICMPWRAVSFVKQRWVFYLADFCYFANVAAVAYLLLWPGDARLEALVYALADGPLAGALVAWQCPWLFGSAEHTVSVLMHLLPGLAMFAHRYHTPHSVRGWRGLADWARGLLLHGRLVPAGPPPLPAVPAAPLAWLVGAPLLFFAAWCLAYFLLVQVLLRRFILSRGYETSYTCLARRAAKTNNIWNRLVRRGSALRRCAVYGGLQGVFTATTLCVAVPTYFCYPLAVLLQVVKVVFPVYYGSVYLMTKVPQHVFMRGMQHLDEARESGSTDTAAAADGAAAAALADSCEVLPSSPLGAQRGSKLHRRSCAADIAVQASPLLQQPLLA